MIGSFVSRRAYGTVSPDFLASVLQRVKDVPQRLAEAQKAEAKKFSQRKNSRDDRRRDGRPSNRDSGWRNNGSREPAVQTGAFKKRGAKLENTNEYNEISGKVDNFAARKSRRSTEKRTRRTVPGLKLSSTLGSSSRNVTQTVSNSSTYVPQDPTPLSLLKYRPNLAPTFTSKALKYTISTLKESNFPLNRSFNDGIIVDGKVVNKRLTANMENFGEFIPASDLKLQLEPLTKNFKVVSDLEKLEQSVKGTFHTLKPFAKKDFAKLSKSEEKRTQLFNNSETVRNSLNQSSTLDAAEKELLYKCCSGLAPISELRN